MFQSDNESLSMPKTDLVDLSYKAKSADEKAKELNDRVTKIESELSNVKAELRTINNEINHATSALHEIKETLKPLTEKSAKQEGFWEGVKQTSKFIGWWIALLSSLGGALFVFLLNKLSNP
jgi:septal ring factor EnvC (AmiA/AmiB activator)